MILPNTEEQRLTVYARELLPLRMYSALASRNGSDRWEPYFEFALWTLVENPESNPDLARSLAGDLAVLKLLAKDAEGWMTWCPVFGKLVFISMPDWLELVRCRASGVLISR